MQHSRVLAPGTMVARDWRIERTLGQGGFGITYEARNGSTGAHVALKEYMPSGLCTRANGSTKVTPAQGPAGDVFKRGLAGFVKEADTLARLDHPSIVRVSGCFEANDTAYMALAYETGGTVADWLKHLGRPPTQDELDRLLWPLTEALREIHALFMLHRDIKPENIMLRGDGTPVMIDFGAVKNIVSSETRSVGAAGTLNFVTDGYAPPEQYVPDGENLLGPWTDIYALGATIYEAVTGARPPVATRRIIDESYRPLVGQPETQHVGGWRPAFLDGIDKALHLRRSDRPQSMMEFRRAVGLVEAPRAPDASAIEQAPIHVALRPPNAGLARPVTFEQLPVGTTSPAARSKAGLGIAAALAVVLIAGGAWRLVQTHSQVAEAQAAQVRAEAEVRRLAAEKATAEAALEEERENLGKDNALKRLTRQIAELTNLVSLERGKANQAQNEIAALSKERDQQKEISNEALAKVDLLNQQLLALRRQMAALNEALAAAEAKDKDAQTRITDLGSRLNLVLARQVQELQRYRSDFFGRLREWLKNRGDIRVVGDRFVFQSEVLFPTGQAQMTVEGLATLDLLATATVEVEKRIPKEIDWVLLIDGHTDVRPIASREFPSNWELSSARATSVVKYLISRGVSPRRLAATGYGEFAPLEEGTTDDVLRRNRRIELKLTNR